MAGMNEKMIDNFLESFSEHSENIFKTGYGITDKDEFGKVMDRSRKEMIDSYKKGDVYKPHTFNKAEMAEIDKHINVTRDMGIEGWQDSNAEVETKKKEAQARKDRDKAEERKERKKAEADALKEKEVKPVNSEGERKSSALTSDSTTKEPVAKEPVVKPPIGETKVERTVEKVKEKTLNRPSYKLKRTSNESAKWKTPTPKTGVWDTKATSSFLGKNRGKIALGGIGLGIAKSWIDGEDDDIGSTTGKAIKTGIGVSVASFGTEHLLKTETIQKMVRGETVDIGKSSRNKIDKKAKMKAGYGKLGVAAKIGLGVVAAATVLDVGARGREHYESAQIEKAQERQILERKQKKKDKGKKSAYGNIDDGEILFDLFDARSGHHKMGNAKFN